MQDYWITHLFPLHLAGLSPTSSLLCSLHWIKPIPDDIPLTAPPQPVVPGPEHDEIVSKMIFRDDLTGEVYTEYIEPLVSHLRFPLCKCADFVPINDDRYHWHSIMFRGYIIPPPPALKVRQKFFFDAGASTWTHQHIGSSLKYFHDMWLRSGHVFDQIFAYEFRTPAEEFYKTVPQNLQDHVHYLQCAVVSSPEEEKRGVSPFLPSVIKREATAADYVLFKLDIDSPKVEHGSIDFILDDPNNIVDEIAFEHHGESLLVHVYRHAGFLVPNSTKNNRRHSQNYRSYLCPSLHTQSLVTI